MEERFKVSFSGKNAIRHIIIVSTNQGIAEVPRMVGKGFVADVKAKGAQIFYDENCCCTSIALAEWMNLPKV